MIYLDNAATSWPCARAAAPVDPATAQPGAPSPDRIAFGPNATWALNLALKGLLKAGDHVVSGSMEHNAVARPLWALERRGVAVTKAKRHDRMPSLLQGREVPLGQALGPRLQDPAHDLA